jgi:hypothetical protein
MGERGREEALARTKGRRKVVADRVEYDEPDRTNVRVLPGSPPPPCGPVAARLVGSCGHTLRWAMVPVVDGEPRPPVYLTWGLGRRVTCMHEGCRIPPAPVREPREGDCVFIIGTDPDPRVGRRCRTHGRWVTDMGVLCTRHRDYLLRGGYLDEPGTPVTLKQGGR